MMKKYILSFLFVFALAGLLLSVSKSTYADENYKNIQNAYGVGDENPDGGLVCRFKDASDLCEPSYGEL
jgi:hypothetical protein